MRTKTIQVYQYGELSDQAKQKARGWWLEGVYGDDSWEQSKNDAEMVGIKLSGMSRGSMTGELMMEFQKVLSLIIQNHGENCETRKTAEKYQKRYDEINVELDNEEYDSRDELQHEFTQEILEDYRIF